MHYYLAPWAWNTTEAEPFWERPRPDLNLGGSDLRSLPEQGPPPGGGVGFFVLTDRPATDPSDWLYLGPDLAGALSLAQLRDAEGLVSAPGQFSSSVLLDCGVELLTQMADPEGVLRVRPLMPTRDGIMEWHLPGNSVVWRERFSPVRHPRVIEMEQGNYRAIRAAALRGEMGPGRGGPPDRDFHRRYLQVLVEKYGLPFERFILAGLPRETPLPHGTTLNDTFNRANQAPLGTSSDGWAWSQIEGSNSQVAGNVAEPPGDTTQSRSRAQSDLAGNDHYAQLGSVNFANAGATVHLIGTLARYQPSGATPDFYQGRIGARSTPAPLRFVDLFKRVSNTFTQLGSTISVTLLGNDVILTQANGSTITCDFNAVTQITQSDSAVVSGTRTGVLLRTGTGVAADAIADNFQAADLAAAGVTYPRLERGIRGLNRGLAVGMR